MFIKTDNNMKTIQQFANSIFSLIIHNCDNDTWEEDNHPKLKSEKERFHRSSDRSKQKSITVGKIDKEVAFFEKKLRNINTEFS